MNLSVDVLVFSCVGELVISEADPGILESGEGEECPLEGFNTEKNLLPQVLSLIK